MLTRGDRYQGRYIAPYERHIHHQAGYGVPFPPKYKDVICERGETSGEAGMGGKHQQNLSTLFVPLAGAKYDCHGIKYYPTTLLMNVDPDASRPAFEKAAERHALYLTGVTSLGYDTPGYGYGVKDKDGVPKLQRMLAAIAGDYNVPYIVDNAWGIPFVGADPRRLGCDVILYSMDKASGSPTAGLIIGKEEPMVQIRRALGMHGARHGTTASYGKAQWVTIDAGKEMLVAPISLLVSGKASERKLVPFVMKNDRIKKVRDWKFSVFDKNQNLVKMFAGKGNIPAYLVWDGKDVGGQYVKDLKECKYVLDLNGYDGKKAKIKEKEIVRNPFVISSKTKKLKVTRRVFFQLSL